MYVLGCRRELNELRKHSPAHKRCLFSGMATNTGFYKPNEGIKFIQTLAGAETASLDLFGELWCGGRCGSDYGVGCGRRGFCLRRRLGLRRCRNQVFDDAPLLFVIE